MVFADVVRSMEIAAVLDMERLREIITDLVERLAAVVRRFGGIVERTGDGVMALFGAPIALEDHAFRACLAALAIQDETHRLAAEVATPRRCSSSQVRVGLNSGQVIAGEHRLGVAGIRRDRRGRRDGAANGGGRPGRRGDAVGVDRTTRRAPRRAGGSGVGAHQGRRRTGARTPAGRHRSRGMFLVVRADASLVGRRWETAAIDALTDRAIGGRGGVVNLVGPPGIGKSRIARETATVAARHGIEVVWTFCESHERDISFRVVTQLLRAASGVTDIDDRAARARSREQFPDADRRICCCSTICSASPTPVRRCPRSIPDVAAASVDRADQCQSARAHRARALRHRGRTLGRRRQRVDAGRLPGRCRAHPSIVLITSRPEYQGALTRVHSAQTIALAPLRDSAHSDAAG